MKLKLKMKLKSKIKLKLKMKLKMKIKLKLKRKLKLKMKLKLDPKNGVSPFFRSPKNCHFTIKCSIIKRKENLLLGTKMQACDMRLHLIFVVYQSQVDVFKI